MPYTLTKQEKEQLKREYLENIRVINECISSRYDDPEYQVKPNLEAFNKRINDPNFQRFYKKSLETKAREDRKNALASRLMAKYSHLKVEGKPYVFNRIIHTELIDSEDEDAMRYNEELIKEYLQFPEAVIQRRFEKVVNMNVSELVDIAKSKDADNLMLDYAAENPTLVEDVFELNGELTNSLVKPLLTPEATKALNTITTNYEPVADTSLGFKKMDKWFFTVDHVITEDQENILGGTDFDTAHRDISEMFAEYKAHARMYDTMKGNFVGFFANLEDKGIDVKKDGALSEVVALQTQPNGDTKMMGLPKWINRIELEGNEPFLAKVSDKEAAGIKKIFKEDYTKLPGYKQPVMPERFRKLEEGERARTALLHTIAKSTGKTVAEIENQGLAEFAKSYAGGLKERMFGTTSSQYKNFIKTLENFDNKNHVGYRNNAEVKASANQYLIHKGVKTLEDAMRLPSPGKERAIFCLATINVMQEKEGPNAPKIIPGTTGVAPVNVQPVVKDWPPAIKDPNEVEDLAPSNENNNIIKKDNSLEEDLSVEDDALSAN